MNPSCRWILLLTRAACSSRESTTTSAGGTASSMASASSPAMSASGSASAHATAGALPVREGKATFLIDAPLEKIKGEVSEVKGTVRLDPADLTRTQGEVSFRLAALKTTTFDDAANNESQTEHARNWMQVGPKSDAADRARYEWAVFRIAALEVTPARLADAPVENGARVVQGKATGDLTLHGVTRSHVVPFKARITGPVEAPTGLALTSDRPVDVSLKDHDVKPRDEVGSLIAGALEKIGKKISDKVQVTLEIRAGS